MIISKCKAKKKLDSIYFDVHDDIKRLAFFEKKAYTSLMAVPSGKRLLRYAKKVKIPIRQVFLFDALIDVHLLNKSKKPKPKAV